VTLQSPAFHPVQEIDQETRGEERRGEERRGEETNDQVVPTHMSRQGSTPEPSINHSKRDVI
jgi:hypothetical protein